MYTLITMKWPLCCELRLLVVVIAMLNQSFCVFILTCFGITEASLGNISLSDFKWLNEPQQWKLENNVVEVTTENFTDFWQGTYYNFSHNSGHVFGVEIEEDFTITACIEANFTTLYDQAGLMVYVDETHWLKAGIEYNDGQPMIGSVLTDGVSDWATGVFTGNPRKFWLRVTKVGSTVVVKYSVDAATWVLLRLSPFDPRRVLVGLMACSPQRQGLRVRFGAVNLTDPVGDILHNN